MKVVIETHLNIEGNKGILAGEFFVNDREFKEDAHWAVAIVAYEWVQQQWREHGCRDVKIDKVTWNNEHDITTLVRQIRPVVDDNLPF